MVSLSYMTIEAIRAIPILEEHGISVEHIDLKCVNPIDWDCILASVRKTGRLLVLDTGAVTVSVAGEVVAKCASEAFHQLKCPPQRIALPDIPTPTSFGLTKDFYPGAHEIVQTVASMMNTSIDYTFISERPHDVPGDWFKGPF